ncbi:uncharacterized protein LOC107367432 [Tetranychus urticae]|uniref:Reelin domain-containing protein n=1 Tax=Tetranychus urticae TaxID=32264 RepID=T1KV22_TETUR|nr:uncharacterized protein LOC107367432 [Tetranychus urticae]
MNSKIFLAFVLAVNLYVVIDAAQVFSYEVTVKTADKKFDSHEGKLKLSVMSYDSKKTSQEDFVLTPTDVKIKKDRTYTAAIASFAPLNNITSVYLRWTLASPFNPYYAIKKPKIYFDSVTLTTSIVNPYTHVASSQSRKFCPEKIPIGIKHADGATFNSCI